MTAAPPVPPPDNRRFELFKFYEEAAQHAKTDAWTQMSPIAERTIRRVVTGVGGRASAKELNAVVDKRPRRGPLEVF